MPYEVPSLDTYIGDLYPQRTNGIPQDPDSINNRVQDVLFHDKTKYDEKVATIVSDYVSIINELLKMVKSKDRNRKNDEIYDQLQRKSNEQLVSSSRGDKSRDIKDLLRGRFRINQVMRIAYGESNENNQKNKGHEKPNGDSDDIFGKAFDYSHTTISYLIKQGYADTLSKWK